MSYLACEAHGGRLVQREQPYHSAEPEPVWVCAGFDGEGIGWCTAGPVPGTSCESLLVGETYWPGVVVLDDDGNVTGLQPERSPESERARQLVNDLLRQGPTA